MLIRSVKASLVGAALLLTFAVPASAQDIFAGLSFLGDGGGTGIQAAITGPLKTLSSGKPLSWVVDGSFHRKSEFDVSVTSILVQGGVRIYGRINDKAEWFGHGMVGIHRSSVNLDFEGLCDLLDTDCTGTSTGLIVTPGGGVSYAATENVNVYGQFDIPIGDGSTTRFSVGVRFKR